MAVAAVCSSGHAQTDDFNDGNDNGWNRYNVLGIGNWTFPSGGYRIRSTAPSPDPINLGPGRAGSVRSGASYTNFSISVDVVDWDDTLDQAFGLLARVTNPGLGTTDGYAFTYQVGDNSVSISRILGEAPSDVPGTSTNAVLDPLKTYRLVFIGRGTELEGRVYELPNVTTPIVTTIGIDELHPSGVAGLVIYDNSTGGMSVADATFDNYSAMAGEPIQLTVAPATPGQVAVSWPSSATGYVLQRANSLGSAASWTDITAGIVDAGGVKTYSESISSAGARYFRLRP